MKKSQFFKFQTGYFDESRKPGPSRKAFSLGRRWQPVRADGCGVYRLSEQSDKTYLVPSTPGPFGATLCKQERAWLRSTDSRRGAASRRGGGAIGWYFVGSPYRPSSGPA